MKNLLFTKIYFLCLSILLSSSYILNAQLTNGDFSNFCQGGNAFQINNCVNNWSNSHGTPTLSSVGNGSAWMWSYNGRGEGIVANFDFDPCYVYQITFSVRTDDRDSSDPNVANTATINLLAANGVPQSNNTTFPTVNDTDVIFSDLMGPYLNNWTTVTVTFAPQSNYSQLWIFPFMQAPSDGVSQAEMHIDDIHIHSTFICCDDCDDFEVTPPSFGYSNILDPCFIEFNSFEEAEATCPDAIIKSGYYVMDYGDGNTDGPNNTPQCDNHIYTCDGVYEACLTYYFTTLSGELCETTHCETIEISGCKDCCEECDVEADITEVSIDGCFATVCNHATYNAPCIKPSYTWTVNGEPAVDQSPQDPITFSHQFNCNGTYEICGTVTVYNSETGTVCTDTNCVFVTIKNCKDCPCDDLAPTNLQVQGGVLNWDPVPGATGYIVSSPGAGQPIIDCKCKAGISIVPINTVVPFLILPANLQDKCFVWQVQAICSDGSISDVSKQHCYPNPKKIMQAQDIPTLDNPRKDSGSPKLSATSEISNISIYPNPAKNFFNIEINSDLNEILKIHLIDQAGKVVIENNTQLLKGINQFNFNLANTPRGVYVLKFSSNYINQYRKLVLIK